MLVCLLGGLLVLCVLLLCGAIVMLCECWWSFVRLLVVWCAVGVVWLCWWVVVC